MMSTAAVILARGGSRRVPQKNLRLFRGQPLLTHSIIASQQSRVFDEVIVSTDDDEIARVAREAGASVPFMRPQELADDAATTDAAMAHAIDQLVSLLPDLTAACCIYPSPFVTATDLHAGLELLEASGAASVVPVVRYDFPVEQAFRLVAGVVVPVDPDAMEMRSQDLAPSYHDAGLFYWTNVHEFRRTRALLAGEVRALEISSVRCQDINTLEDWVLAELKYDLAHGTDTAP